MKTIVITLTLLLFFVVSASSFAQTPLTITKPFEGTVVEVPFTIVGTATPLSQLQVVVNNESIGLFNVDAEGNFRVPVDIASTTFQIEVVRLENGNRAESATLNLTSNGQATPAVTKAPKPVTKDPVIIQKKSAEPVPNNGAYSDLPADGKMSRGGRIALEIGTGIVAGILFTALAAVAIDSSNSEEVAWLGAVSVVALSAGSVWGVGELSGGNGSYLATLGGTLLGIGAGFGVALLTIGAAFNGNNNEGLIIGGIFVAASLPVAGAVLGYELSQSDTVSAPNPQPAQQPKEKKRRLMWLVAPTQNGGTLQVGSTF